MLTALMSISLLGCANTKATENAQITKSEYSIKNISGEELEKIQQEKTGEYLIIDVRDKVSYEKGHLKDAINIETKDIAKNVEPIVKWRKKQVVVYANTQKESKEATEKFQKQGFKNILNAQGMEEYKNYKLVSYTNLIGAKFQDAIWEESGQFFDGRDKTDFDGSRVKNAKNYDTNNLETLASLLPQDKQIPVYFYSYKGEDSKKAAEKAIELGYKNVYNALVGTKEFNYKYEPAECCLPENKNHEKGQNH